MIFLVYSSGHALIDHPHCTEDQLQTHKCTASIFENKRTLVRGD